MKRKLMLGILVTTIATAATTTVGFAQDRKLARVPGPAQVELGGKLAKIDLPAGYSFIKKEAAAEILKANGSSPEGVLGLIVPQAAFDSKNEKDPKANNFFVVCRFEDVGHVRDDDATKLNADEILNSYKEGTKDQNEDRKQQGIPPLYVGGWAEKPRYEKAQHQVVWAIEVKDAEDANSPVTGINYNTRILGRHGVLSMNLVTDPDRLTENKKNVSVLLADTTFNRGEKYEEYKQGTDKDAGYGLAGLILGGGALAAAAKFGLLGGAWKFILAALIAGKKLILVAVIGIGALISKFTGKKKSEP